MVGVFLLMLLVLVAVAPFLLGEFLLGGLIKLDLSPGLALALVCAMLVGGLVNIPVRRTLQDKWISVHPLAAYGLSGFWPRMQERRREMVISVNLGGCVIPLGIAAYELAHIAAHGRQDLMPAIAACLADTLLCYLLARPVAGIGIIVPGVVSALVAAGLALLLAHDLAAPVAFVAGVIGPLVGADLLHLREAERSNTGVMSIGGAGTFDGIVLSGIIAAYLA